MCTRVPDLTPATANTARNANWESRCTVHRPVEPLHGQAP